MPETLAPVESSPAAAPEQSGGPTNRRTLEAPFRQTPAQDRQKAALARSRAAAADFAAGKLPGQKNTAPAGTSPATPFKIPLDDQTTGATPPAADDTLDAPEATAEKPKPKAEPTVAEKAVAKEKATKVTAAKRALALDGWEPEDIEALPEDKLLRIGAHRAKNQGDVNREFAKLRSAGQTPRNDDGTFAPAKVDAETAPEPKAAKKAPEPKSVTGDAEIDAMIDGAAEEIGEPAVKLLKAITGKLAAKMQGQGDMGNAVTTEMIYSQGAEVVGRDYPDQLKASPELFDEVADNFKALVASGRYGRGQMSKAWRDAAFMQFGAPDAIRNTQREMLNRQSAADKGRVDSGKGDTGTTTETAPITGKKDQLRFIAQQMVKNKNADPDKLRDALMSRIGGRRAG